MLKQQGGREKSLLFFSGEFCEYKWKLFMNIRRSRLTKS